VASRVSLEFSRMRYVYPPGGFTRACPACLAAWLYFPFAALGPVDYDRHVIFDNSLADGSRYHSRSHVVGPSELDLVDGNLPVDGSHYLTPPNALRLNWRSATGGDCSVIPDVRGRYGRVEFPRLRFAYLVLRRRCISPEQAPRISLSDSDHHGIPAIPRFNAKNVPARGNRCSWNFRSIRSLGS
jgi:hypothetical protein